MWTQLRMSRTKGSTMKKEAAPKPSRVLVDASFLLDGRSASANHCTARISLRVRGTNFESCGTPGTTYKRVSWSLTCRREKRTDRRVSDLQNELGNRLWWTLFGRLYSGSIWKVRCPRRPLIELTKKKPFRKSYDGPVATDRHTVVSKNSPVMVAEMSKPVSSRTSRAAHRAGSSPSFTLPLGKPHEFFDQNPCTSSTCKAKFSKNQLTSPGPEESHCWYLQLVETRFNLNKIHKTKLS